MVGIYKSTTKREGDFYLRGIFNDLIPDCGDFANTAPNCPHKEGKKCWLWENIPDNEIGCPYAREPKEKVIFT